MGENLGELLAVKTAWCLKEKDIEGSILYVRWTSSVCLASGSGCIQAVQSKTRP